MSETEGGDATDAVKEAELEGAEEPIARQEKGRWGSMGLFPAAAIANLFRMLRELPLFRGIEK